MILLTLLVTMQNATAMATSFELRASTSTVSLGTPVAIAGTTQYPENFQLSVRTEDQNTEPFTISDIQLGQPKVKDGQKIQPVRIQVVPFDLGAQTFPALEWTLTDASGAVRTFKSPPVKLEVTGPDTRSSELRDIIDPLKPPFWMLLILVLLAAATLGLIAYESWVFLKPKRDAEAAKLAARKPAHEEALEALENLRESGGNIRESYERLSEILRVYLERRYDIPALLMTTSDLLRIMRQAEIDRPVIGLTKDIFTRCDLVKFAKLIPEAPELRQDLDAAVQIIKSTAPKPQQEPLNSDANLSHT